MRTGLIEEIAPFQGVIAEIWSRRWCAKRHFRRSGPRSITVYESPGYPISERTKQMLTALRVADRLAGPEPVDFEHLVESFLSIKYARRNDHQIDVVTDSKTANLIQSIAQGSV